MRRRCNSIRGRRGMTLIDLSIGMVITSLVVGALASLWFAMGQTWANSGTSQSVTLTGAQAVSRLESTMRQAKYIFQYTAGSTDGKTTPAASALIWKGDNWNSTADGAVQVGEMALVEHDPVAQKIYLYQAIPIASMNATQIAKAGGVVLWIDLSKSTTPAAFKAYDFVQKTVISEAVAGAAFNAPTPLTGARPSLEYTLTVTRSGSSTLVYSVASLRGPTTRPL
jgi:Tfp pilus assembly protein PilW